MTARRGLRFAAGANNGNAVSTVRPKSIQMPSRVVETISDVQSIFNAAVRRVQADSLLQRAMGSIPADQPLKAYNGVRVVGMGKAALAMAGVLEARYADHIASGCVVVPTGYPETIPDRFHAPSSVEVLTGGHPMPSEKSAQAGRRILEEAQSVGTEDLLIVCVSGGGTALASVPVDTLDVPDLKTTYHRLLTGGVPIRGANIVRKHLTQVGGGQLARAAHPAEITALIISDVPGDDLSTIASGPTVPDPSTYEDAIRTLYTYDLWHDVPATVRDHLVEGAENRKEETPGPGASCFDRTDNRLLGTNETALEAARSAAESEGYTVQRMQTGVEGEAKEVGREHVREMIATEVNEPTCWLWGGETTVTVTGDGMGGRNQEVAVGAALELDTIDEHAVLLSAGTDGIDGPTDAAGAWASPETLSAVRSAGLDPQAHLADNDTYPLLDEIDHLLRTGPTHTNVMDVHVGLVRPTS